jgi:hypothetical protein
MFVVKEATMITNSPTPPLAARLGLKLFIVQYDVKQPVDRHPIGPRCRAVFARDEEHAQMMVAHAYDMRPVLHIFTFRKVTLAQHQWEV